MAARLTLGRALLVAALVIGCGGSVQPAITPRPVASAGPNTNTSGAVALTRAAIRRALGAVGLQLDDARIPVRAPEPVSLDAVPRTVAQALLPDDPNHGFITIYDFPTTTAAADGGRALASYLRTGFGRAQFTPDARHTIRQFGTTVVYFSWSPASSPDHRTAEIENALLTVGSEVPLPG